MMFHIISRSHLYILFLLLHFIIPESQNKRDKTISQLKNQPSQARFSILYQRLSRIFLNVMSVSVNKCLKSVSGSRNCLRKEASENGRKKQIGETHSRSLNQINPYFLLVLCV